MRKLAWFAVFFAAAALLILLLPAVLRVFDPVIMHTSMGFRDVISREKNIKKEKEAQTV